MLYAPINDQLIITFQNKTLTTLLVIDKMQIKPQDASYPQV